MKKRNFVWFVLMLVSVLGFPMSTYAASGAIFGANSDGYVSSTKTFDEAKTTLNGNAVSVQNQGDSTVIYLGVKVTDGTVNNFNATLTLSKSTFKFKKYARASGWSGSIKDNNDGTISVNLTNATGVTKSTGDANGNNLVATITLDASGATSTDTCEIGLKQNTTTTETPKCKIENGKYYDNSGKEVTEAEYKAACETTENPQTGSFLPYAVIVGGVLVAGALYFMTKKNKIYHI